MGGTAKSHRLWHAVASGIIERKRFTRKRVLPPNKNGGHSRHLRYPRWESNPNLRFRKPPFYPLNYKGNIVWETYMRFHGTKITKLSTYRKCYFTKISFLYIFFIILRIKVVLLSCCKDIKIQRLNYYRKILAPRYQ